MNEVRKRRRRSYEGRDACRGEDKGRRRREGSLQVDGPHFKAAAPRRGLWVNNVTVHLLRRADVKRTCDPAAGPDVHNCLC